MKLSLYARDLVERVAATFLEGFLGSLVITRLADKDVWLAALGGGVAAVSALFKGLAAKKVGNSDSASLDGDV